MTRAQQLRICLLICAMLAVMGFLAAQILPLERPSTGIPPAVEQTPYSFGPASFDGIGKFYMGREISDMIAGHGAIRWLERADREQSEKPAVVIAELDLRPDSVVADIGAGSGYFTFRIAPLIPRGKIYAVEIGPDMLAYLKTKTVEAGIDNVVVHEGTPSDTRLPAGKLDVAFMVDAYHEFSHPREMMESILTALKPGGRVVFVEYRGEDPQIPIKPRHKMTVAQLTKEMNALGLVKVRVNTDLPTQHITTYRKP